MGQLPARPLVRSAAHRARGISRASRSRRQPSTRVAGKLARNAFLVHWTHSGGEVGMELVLTAVDVEGPLRWRWLLSSAETGEPLAEYRVRLSEQASNELAAFRDLYGYARWRSAPDRQVEDGARIVAGDRKSVV